MTRGHFLRWNDRNLVYEEFRFLTEQRSFSAHTTKKMLLKFKGFKTVAPRAAKLTKIRTWTPI